MARRSVDLGKGFVALNGLAKHIQIVVTHPHGVVSVGLGSSPAKIQKRGGSNLSRFRASFVIKKKELPKWVPPAGPFARVGPYREVLGRSARFIFDQSKHSARNGKAMMRLDSAARRRGAGGGGSRMGPVSWP